MAADHEEVNTPLLENILSQPAALQAVGQHHLGDGRAALASAAALLTSSKRVIISGMGASFFACLPLVYQLSARVVTVEASELLYFLASQMEPGTVVLLVSRSGESVEVLKLLPEARRRGASILGVTNVAHSTLNREADRVISMASPPDQLVAIQTFVATVATFALLAAAIENELDVAGHELEQAAEVLQDWIPECVQARETWSEFLMPGDALYLLGRGPAMGSVAEGQLLMHEIAKSAAVGMSVAQFRHGPVEVVDRNFRAIVWGTQPVTSALDAALATDLAHMGAQVRWIGPARADADVNHLVRWPSELPRRFHSLAEIIPLQIAAYRKAELLGVRPGDFRWAPAITSSETGFAVPSPR